MLKEITLSNGKKVRVVEAGGYHDGYYWDMTATVEIDGIEYTVQDAGSGSGYVPIFQSMSKNGPCKLTGVELEPVNDKDGDWDYIFYAIEDIAESFFANNAEESYEYYDDYINHSTHIDGVKVDADEDNAEVKEQKETEFHRGVEESGGHAYNCNDCTNKCEEWHKWNKEG